MRAHLGCNRNRVTIMAMSGYALGLRQPLNNMNRALQCCKPQRLPKRSRGPLTTTAFDERDDGGFGARDPRPEELASNFSDKVLGHYDTAHIVRGPDGMKKFVGLGAKRCAPCEAGKAVRLASGDVTRLRNQVPGWKLTEDAGGVQCLRQEWKVKNFTSGLEMFTRIAAIAEAEGHHPDLHLESYNTVYAELSTHAVGGLTENDFIMAAKINQLDFSDLHAPKKKRTFFY